MKFYIYSNEEIKKYFKKSICISGLKKHLLTLFLQLFKKIHEINIKIL